MFSDLVRVLMPATLSFLIGLAITPVVSDYLYEYKAWKKTPGKRTLYGEAAEEFNRLNNGNETRAPRRGGIIVWGSVLLATIILILLSIPLPNPGLLSLEFLSRNE